MSCEMFASNSSQEEYKVPKEDKMKFLGKEHIRTYRTKRWAFVIAPLGTPAVFGRGTCRVGHNYAMRYYLGRVAVIRIGGRIA